MDSNRVIFTGDEIASLKGYQECGMFHPYTCSQCGCDLVPEPEGLTCPCTCSYQTWVFDWTKDWRWKREIK